MDWTTMDESSNTSNHHQQWIIDTRTNCADDFRSTSIIDDWSGWCTRTWESMATSESVNSGGTFINSNRFKVNSILHTLILLLLRPSSINILVIGCLLHSDRCSSSSSDEWICSSITISDGCSCNDCTTAGFKEAHRGSCIIEWLNRDEIQEAENVEGDGQSERYKFDSTTLSCSFYYNYSQG